MKLPLQITFRNMDSSPAIDREIRERAEALDKYSDDIMSCRVVVEAPHRRHRTGHNYRVLVDLTVPGQELVAGRDRDRHGKHEDVFLAIRDAFDAARRELQDYVRRRQGKVKSKNGPQHAWIADVYPAQGYGFLEVADGRRVYFHANSVAGHFEDLEIGQEVRFAEAEGEKGPQATIVSPVGKSGHTVPPKPMAG